MSRAAANRLRAAFAASLLLLLPLGALAQREYVQRMKVWEKEKGTASRLTLYAEIEAMELPAPPPELLASIAAAARDPFVEPLPSARAMAPLVSSWEPAFKLLYAAWSLEECGGFERKDARDPDLALKVLPVACAILACRAQAHAAIGSYDAALGDASTIWLAGKSLEANAPSFWAAYVGSQMRGMGLVQLRAIVEGYGDKLGDERIRRLAEALQAQPGRSRSAALAVRDEMNLAFAFLRSESPKHAADIDLARKELNDLLQQLARRDGRLEAYPGIVREIVGMYPPLENFPIPNAAEAILREIWADALENVLLAALWTMRANAAATDGAPASPEAIIKTAGEEAARERLLDPFTGFALKIINGEDGAVTVAAAGPDGEVELDLIRELDIADGLKAQGDVVVRLPWDDWHQALRRGRDLTAADIPRGSGAF